jgi:protein TonB
MLNDKVARTAFLISFVGHCLFLGVPGFNPSLRREIKTPEEVIVRIEIEKPPLLPKIDIMGEEKKIREVVEEQKPSEPEPELEPQSKEIVMEESSKEPIKEKVEVIDPQEEAMLRYQDMVKQKIESHRKYPNWAKRQGLEGITYLYFIVLPNGLGEDIRIIRSSGSSILDEEAVSMVKRASPFPAVPKEITSSSVGMEVAIVFSLNKN